MNLKPYIEAAGLVQLVIAAANFVLPGMLKYRENLARVSVIVRHIFTVHAVYIVIVLLGFAAMSLVFADDLCGGSRLGMCLSGFLAVFWLLRVAIQVGYYDREIKGKHRMGNAFFTLAFLYLGLVYGAAAFCKL